MQEESLCSSILSLQQKHSDELNKLYVKFICKISGAISLTHLISSKYKMRQTCSVY